MNIDISQILDPIFIVNIALLIALALYIIFAFIVFKQIKSLNNIVKAGSASSFLELVSLIHLFAAIILFLISLAIL